MSMNIDEWDRTWNKMWPNYSPYAIDFKNSGLRLFSLPGGKRYPETEGELVTVLERYNQILDELNPEESVFVITSRWSNSASPSEENGHNDDDGFEYWQSVLENPEEDKSEFKSYRHMYVSKLKWRIGVLDKLLKDVIEDKVSGVIIASKDLAWLFHPYDGGMDIIFKSETLQSKIKSSHSNWIGF